VFLSCLWDKTIENKHIQRFVSCHYVAFRL
jgi:hypothetical protein